MDLEHLSTGWVELAPFPGKPRIQPVCAVQKDEKGEYAIYLWGGFAPASSEREASLSTDGYRYSLSQKEWVPLVSPTNTRGEAVSLGGGAAVSVGDSLILCMGGVNKDVFYRLCVSRLLIICLILLSGISLIRSYWVIMFLVMNGRLCVLLLFWLAQVQWPYLTKYGFLYKWGD